MLSRLLRLKSPSLGLSRHMSQYSVGQKLCQDSWKIASVQNVPEFNLEAIELHHCHGGAKYLHLSSPDEINSFSVNFKTTPMDSTGISHILEHVTLCGSEKFPVRDPFFKMLNRSLATFMNAMTGPDYTLYPFSTPNKKDFYNLLSVYLDAVFKANLSEQDFRQEGWRLEQEDTNDPNSRIVIKGVVFNEMKGVYADPQQVFGRHLMSKILPSHTYGNCSGGLPEKIPDLTWQNLRDFHKKHYSPNNARFFSHGNLELDQHLDAIAPYLPTTKSTYVAVDNVPNEKKWKNPKEAAITCAPNPAAPLGTVTVSVAFLSCDINDAYESFVLQLISGLLVDGSNSPFYKTLLETGLGSAFAPSTGYDPHTKDTLFAVGLQGVATEKKDQVLNAIKNTLAKAAEEGFEQDRIDAILNRTELSLKNKKNNFGLNLIMALTPTWNHTEESPVVHMDVNGKIERLRKDLKENPKFLQQKMKQYFVDNPHQLTLVMTPSEDFNELEQQKLDAVQDKKVKDLTEKDFQELRLKAKELEEAQNSIEDLNSLPTLRISDISDRSPRYNVQSLEIGGVPSQISLQPTNEISFFRALVNTQHLSTEMREVLPLFASIMTQMGAGKFDFRRLDTEVDLRSGGLSSSYHLSEFPSDLKKIKEGILIGSHCLNRKIGEMFELWTDIFNDLHLKDSERLKTLIKLFATDAMNGLSHSGHMYAMNASSAGLQMGTGMREQSAGIEQILFMTSLAKQDQVNSLVARLQTLAKLLLNKEQMQIALNTTSENEQELLNATAHFVDSIPGSYQSFELNCQPSFESKPKDVYIQTPFPVHFCSTSLPTVPYEHEDFASLRIMARLVSLKFLHKEIREKGGAYGGGLVCDTSGVLSFYSYRDPNFRPTFEAFDKSLNWVMEKSFTEQDIDEAKLGVFQRVDGPVLPGDRGMRNFLTGVTDDMFDKHRQALKDVSKNDIVRVAEKYLGYGNVRSRAVIGPQRKNLKEDSWKLMSIG